MPSKFECYPEKSKKPAAFNGYWILCRTHDASSSFLDIFEKTREDRGAKGTPTDEEQDLLRAMLIFATSGLDSMLKQLVKDALPIVITKDKGAENSFRSHVEKTIIRNNQLNAKLLTSALLSVNSRDVLIQELIKDLSSSSLQSKDELLKIASFFNIPSSVLTKDFVLLEKIFDARNQIAHEMDIDFKQRNRNRKPRSKDDMIKYTSEILKIAEKLLKEVYSKL